MSTETMRDVAVGATIVAALVVVLRAFYSAFESQWPQHYFGGSQGVDPVISQTLFRYVAFRFGPVLLAAVVAGTVAARLDVSRLWATLAVVSVHALTGSGRGLVNALRAEPPRIALATYRLIAILVCAAAAGSALLVGDAADPYVPTAKELSSAFWIALAVFAVAHAGRSLTAQRPTEPELLERAQREVPAGLVRRLQRAPTAHPQAAIAIAYVEHLNRPAWARRLERLLKPRHGTYGLMQMRSPAPLDDQESVNLFLERFPEYPPLGSEEYPTDLRDFFLHHNDDAAFADLAESIYWLLKSNPVPEER